MTADQKPLSLADAEMITRTRHLGWDSGTYAEAQDLRLAAMREGLSPQAFDQDAPEYRAAIRRAHLVGVAAGLVLAFVSLKRFCINLIHTLPRGSSSSTPGVRTCCRCHQGL